MRILIGPVEISGVAKGLSRGLAELGADTQVVLAFKHPFAYGGNRKGWLLSVWQFLGQLRSAPGQHIIRKVLVVAMHRTWGFLVLLWALFAFDAFVFLYGMTLTGTRLELLLLRRLGKKIIFINVGSDFRPPYMDGSVSPPTKQDPDIANIARLARRAKRKILLHERFADYIVSSPSSAHFHERPVINWFAMGVPPTFEVPAALPFHENACVRVVHSPSNSLVKGSEIICSIIQQLIEEGAPLELIRLEGVSNEEVLRQLHQCDMVVDQLYSDIPMAVLGSEAARFAKPCVVGGYLADNVAAYIPDEYCPPSLYVLPERLKSAIEELVENADLRRDLGLRAQQFVSQRWSCRTVAERYWALLQGKPQPDWWFDPANITYVGGCGLSLAHTARLVTLLIERFGVDSLQVSDKPELQKALVELAGQFSGKQASA